MEAARGAISIPQYIGLTGVPSSEKWPARFIAFERNGNFKVRLDVTDHVIKARCNGKMNRAVIKCAVGDSVRVELTPYDPGRGRITYRWPKGMGEAAE